MCVRDLLFGFCFFLFPKGVTRYDSNSADLKLAVSELRTPYASPVLVSYSPPGRAGVLYQQEREGQRLFNRIGEDGVMATRRQQFMGAGAEPSNDLLFFFSGGI